MSGSPFFPVRTWRSVHRVVELLNAQDMADVVVLVGGIIPDEDVAPLKALGVKGVFGPGTSTQDIIGFIRQSVAVPVAG